MDPQKLCSVADCAKRAGTTGLCRTHYRRHYYATHREHEIRTASARARRRKSRGGG